MGPSPGPLLPGRTPFRLLFLLAALDRAAWGGWALLRPHDLFAFLQVTVPGPSPHDDVPLWRLLGVLALAHAAFLVILVGRPEACGSAALVPLLGYAVGTGLWLGLAASERAQLPSRLPPLLLAAHDAVWLPGCAWFPVAWQRWRSRPARLAAETPSARA